MVKFVRGLVMVSVCIICDGVRPMAKVKINCHRLYLPVEEILLFHIMTSMDPEYYFQHDNAPVIAQKCNILA